MNENIVVQKRTVYGVDKIYPLSENAHHICSLLGQKTLTVDNIKFLKLIGFTIMVEPDYPEML